MLSLTAYRSKIEIKNYYIWVIHLVNGAECQVITTFPCTGLLQMIVVVLTTCHTQYTSDSSICIFFLFNRATLEVLVTYFTGAVYVQPL